jgi:hypothetical protein
VQRDHELPDQAFPERVRGDQLGELSHQLPLPAKAQLQVEALFGDGEPLLLQPHRGRLDRPASQAQHGGSAPQPQRGPELGGRCGGFVPPGQVAGLGHEVREDLRVQLSRARQDLVTATGRDDRGLRCSGAGQGPAQGGDVVLDLAPGGRWGSVVPDRVHQVLQRHHLAGIDQ